MKRERIQFVPSFLISRVIEPVVLFHTFLNSPFTFSAWITPGWLLLQACFRVDTFHPMSHPMSHQPPQLNIPPSETDAEEAELIKLHAQWEEHMTDLSPQRRYKHVAVLLLFWDKVEASYLDTSEEVITARSIEGL